jgi:hypothetical protein
MMEYSMQNDGNVEGKIMGKKCIYIYIYTYLSKTFGNVVQEFVEKIFSWGTNTVGKIP